MTHQPAAVRRPLTDTEKDLLCFLAVCTVAEQGEASMEEAAEVLGDFAERGESCYKADAWKVHLFVAGHSIVRATREWLAFHATWAETNREEAYAEAWKQKTPNPAP